MDATIQTHPAPEAAQPRLSSDPQPPKPAPAVNGAPVYEWDRTVEENRQKEAARIETERLARLPFPAPKAKTLPWPDFCDYWNSLRTLPVAPCVRLYVQRWLPVLLPVVEIDRFGASKESHPSDLKILPSDGALSEDLILQLGGVGDYTFRLNDTRRPWEQGTVCQSQLETKRLWDTYPPIFDLKRLDYEDKKNQVFIKFARARGILPREDEQEREVNDMANAAITDRALDEASKERARADQIQKEQLDRARAETESTKLELARVETEAAEAKRQAEEAKTKVQPGTPAAELMSVVSSVATLSNSLRQAPDTSFKDYLVLEAEREKTRRERDKEERDAARESARVERERADKFQAELIAIRTATPAATVTVAPAPTQIEILQQEVQKKELLKKLYGNPAGEEEDKPGKMDKWLEAAPIIAPIFGSIVNGVFQTFLTGLQVWERIHYNDAVAKQGGSDLKMPTSADKTAEPGKPIPPQVQTQTPEQIAQQQHWDAIMRNAFLVVPHMLSSLESDPPETGVEFATFIIKRGPEKRVSYDKLRNLAEDLKQIGIQVQGGNELERFVNAARFVFEKLPAPLNRILGIPAVPKFLAEFHGYDEFMAEQENQG